MSLHSDKRGYLKGQLIILTTKRPLWNLNFCFDEISTKFCIFFKVWHAMWNGRQDKSISSISIATIDWGPMTANSNVVLIGLSREMVEGTMGYWQASVGKRIDGTVGYQQAYLTSVGVRDGVDRTVMPQWEEGGWRTIAIPAIYKSHVAGMVNLCLEIIL